MRQPERVTATVALLSVLVVPSCSADPGFRDGRALLEATNVCAGPIEMRDDDSWSCPSGRPHDAGEALIVAEVDEDPADLRATLDELLEFSKLLDTVVLHDGWFVFGLSSSQATQVIERIGGHVVSHGRAQGERPRVTSAPGTDGT
jgi:hypothetical protein